MTRRLEQVQGAGGVDAPVGVRVRRRPVVRRLRRGVDDQLDGLAVLLEQAADALLIADVEIGAAKLRVGVEQALRRPGGRCLRAEEPRPHVVLDPDDVEAGADEVRDRFRPDQPARTRDDHGRHGRGIVGGRVGG